MPRGTKRPGRRGEQSAEKRGKFSETLCTLEDLAARFGCTTRAVHQSESNALRKLWKLRDDPEFMAMLVEAVVQ